MSKVNPDYKMKCQEWASEVDKSANRRKYDGKVIELTGLVGNLFYPDTTRHNITLLINDPGSTEIGVYAALKGREAWKMVLPGQTVTVRGRYSTADERGLNGSKIIVVSGKPHGSVTADELVAAAKNPEEAKAKYGDYKRVILLTGKVLSIRKASKPGRVDFVMTPPGTSPLLVVTATNDLVVAFFAEVKEGQTIKVLGILEPQEKENQFTTFTFLAAD